MADDESVPLRATTLCISVPGRELVTNLSVAFAKGDFVALLGRNGAGKTLTLETLAGLRPPGRGRITLDGKDIAERARRDIARRLALLPQAAPAPFPETARERVMAGRYPHIERFARSGQRDASIVTDSLRAVDLDGLADAPVLSMSGGEQQRVALAQLLTQQPAVYLLDEPTNHLDVAHQHRVLAHFERLAADGAVIAAALHDVNLAARYASRFLLLFGDGDWICAGREEALTAENLRRLYGIDLKRIELADGVVQYCAGAVA